MNAWYVLVNLSVETTGNSCFDRQLLIHIEKDQKCHPDDVQRNLVVTSYI